MPTTPPGGSRPDGPPFSDVRAAFDRLATPDKAAFVLEATFDTIGQALAETGRRVADAVSSLDLDSVFRDPMRPADAPMPGTGAPDADVAAAAAAAATGEASTRPGRTRRDPGVPPRPDGPSAS